jgi:hypothetical protein
MDIDGSNNFRLFSQNATGNALVALTAYSANGNIATNSILSNGTIGGTSANFVGTLTGSATTAGTVTTAAQPNITSVGTLSGLSVSTATGQIGLATDSGGALSLGLTNGNSSNPYIDFNTSNTAVDYNVRLSAGGPSTGVGAGTLTIMAGTTNVTGSLQTTALTAGSNTTAGSIIGNWTLTAGSRLQSTYADLAEYYEADDNYFPGTVLMFGGDKEVTIADSGTNKVAGVVSTNPAYVMNTTCPGLLTAIALQGRVPCKVQGNISKGDMLISGGNGFAVSTSFPMIGTVIGKALEDFSGVDGVIEVAVGRI